MTELPNIKSIRTGTTGDGRRYAEAVFTNSAILRYVREQATTGSAKIVEEVFAPSDPHSVMERSTVVHPPTDSSPSECLVESLDVYDAYEDVALLTADWSTLGEWILHE
jgi:hypothetical protein